MGVGKKKWHDPLSGLVHIDVTVRCEAANYQKQ